MLFISIQLHSQSIDIGDTRRLTIDLEIAEEAVLKRGVVLPQPNIHQLQITLPLHVNNIADLVFLVVLEVSSRSRRRWLHKNALGTDTEQTCCGQ
jgi:hypothetical protein